MAQRKYDSTVARIAGNIMSGVASNPGAVRSEDLVERIVKLARLIVAEVERTEPESPK